MLKLKKTAVAVLALGSSVAFAGTMGPVCAPGNVTIPCERSAWDLGAKALYLQTTRGGLWDGNFVSTVGTGTVIRDFDNRWNWGFMIEGSYHFNTGNDLNLNWYHVGNSRHRFFDEGSFIGAFSAHPKWDAVNLEFGQEIDLSDMKSIRVHAGVEYARIQHRYGFVASSIPVVFGTPLTLVTPGVAIGDNMTYNGFGPRIGADFNYGLGNGFGIYANGAGSLLVGTLKQSVGGFVGTDATFFNVSASKTTVVPEMEAKLGARYDFAMAQGDLGLDVGYMWVNYFDAQATTFFGNDANFGVHGVYAGLKWVGNV
jgi:hypothetical protein